MSCGGCQTPRPKRSFPAGDLGGLTPEKISFVGQHHYQKKRRLWEQLLQTAPGSKDSWLTAHENPWGVGCKVCAAAGKDGPLARFAVIQPMLKNLLKHGRSPGHASSLRKWHAALGDLGDLGSLDGAPSADEFRALWLSMVRTRSHHGLVGMGTWRRTRRLEWCLAEARRVLHRRFLRTAGAVTLLQDARKNMLLLRAVAANDRLETRAFVLGIERDYGSSNVAIQRATMKIIKGMCQMGRHAPGGPGDSGGPGGPHDAGPGRLDASLHRHLLQAIELFVADGAADEQLAGRELQSPSAAVRPLLPNLRIVLRDKAHASRRPALIY
jgi:hypothetical protein